LRCIGRDASGADPVNAGRDASAWRASLHRQ